MKKNQNNRIEIIFSRLSELYKIDWIYLERVFFLQLILALICCVCFGFRVFFFFLFVFVFWFFGCLPNTGNGDDWWAHAACFALPRWLTVHDNAPRATNALATLPAMWNLRTQRLPRNTLPRQQQNSSTQARLGSTFDVRSMAAVAVAQRRRHCRATSHQEGALSADEQKVGERRECGLSAVKCLALPKND